MGKTKFCRICRTESNLKYTAKELRQLNKKQLHLDQGTQHSKAKSRAYKKRLLTTHTLGNICKVCDERIQIFHRLDDGGHESCSDVEIDVVNDIDQSLPITFSDSLQQADILQRSQRPETPVIVDDDAMLFNIFMQKFDQKTQLLRHDHINSTFSQQQAEKPFTNQFHATYTPPQSTGGSSEGDESKVIEVSTSRESTPIPTTSTLPITANPNIIDSQGHRIVAIIELDDNDEHETKSEKCGSSTPIICSTSDLLFPGQIKQRSISLSQNKNSNITGTNANVTSQPDHIEDDEEIVFCKVEIGQEQISAVKKRKRKSYDEKELRLVASLSLVSSDSETEDNLLRTDINNITTSAVAETLSLTVKNSKEQKCKFCHLIFPDLACLLEHERIHQGVKCILCQMGFQQTKRLIHHMRRKHREYNGDTLSEKPRTAQDSCMTIRLRYMQHTTFYECQLCGRIDDVFREHKEHIIEKHPNESKSLKDPIMKQLKCPICKAKCGAQYLSLCRHLISSHEYQDYKTHLRELLHVSAFGWNTARQQEVSKTAKIFQFVKRKTFFFECKICGKVVAGYLHHLRHATEHQKSRSKKMKAEINAIKGKIPIGAATSPVARLNTSNLDKLCKSLKKDGECISMKLRKKNNVSKEIGTNAILNKSNKAKQSDQIINIPKKTLKPKDNCVHSNLKPKQPEKFKKVTKTYESSKFTAEMKNEPKRKMQLKNKITPKETQMEKLPNSVKITKGKSKKEINNKDNKSKEKSSKLKSIDLKQQIKKVKVKSSIRQIELQKYKCKYCFQTFKGFLLYNLHLLQQHKENEYSKCSKCNKVYVKFSYLKEHITRCSQIQPASKQKRKFTKQVSLSENLIGGSEPCVKQVPNNSEVNSNHLEDNYLWLEDLLKLKEPLEISDSFLNFQKSPNTALFTQTPVSSQCCYCLHLFANDNELMEHKKHNHLENPEIFIKFKPFNNP